VLSNLFLLIRTCLSSHILDVSLATFKTSVLPCSRCLSCHIPDVSLATFKTSLLPRSRHWSCHVPDVSLATFKTSVLPRSRRLATFRTSVLPPPRHRNNDEICVIGKETSYEMTFEGVRCLSFSRQYKVAIASNASFSRQSRLHLLLKSNRTTEKQLFNGKEETGLKPQRMKPHLWRLEYNRNRQGTQFHNVS
jgi:hypothetical protein